MSGIYNLDIRKLDGTLLLIFRELMRQRSATEAGKQLNLTQSAVSNALKRLRDIFDDPLFVRQSHGLAPTKRATELGPNVETLIALTSDIIHPSTDFQPSEIERKFILAAPEFVTAAVANRLARKIQNIAPGVSLLFGHKTPEIAYEQLRKGQIDIAIGRFGTTSHLDVDLTLLFQDEFCVVARRGHPDFKDRISKTAYRTARHIFAGAATELTSEEMDPGFTPTQSEVVVPQWLSALNLVATSDAIATCPKSLAESVKKTFGLKIVKPPFVPYRFAVSMLTYPSRRDPGVDWLSQQIQGLFSK